MKILKKDIIKLADDTEYHRYTLDGVPTGGAGPQGEVTVLDTFLTKAGGKIVMVDQFCAGVSYGNVATALLTLEADSYLGQVGPKDITDSLKPIFWQMMPLGFYNPNGGELGNWAPKDFYAYSSIGYTLVILIRAVTTGVHSPQFTVQFRVRTLDARN